MKKMLFLTALLFSTMSHAQKTIDGNAADWTGVAPTVVHETNLSNGEFIYVGEPNDARTDLADKTSSNDIVEVRFAQDATYLYFMVKMRDITATGQHYNLCMTINDLVGASNLAWIGDQSDTNLGDNAAQQGDRALSIGDIGNGTTHEIAYHAGGSWYNPNQTVAGSWSLAFSTTNEVIEGRVTWASLGYSSGGPASLVITLGSFGNNFCWPENGFPTACDQTTDIGGVSDCIDAMTPFADAGSSWTRDMSDGDIDYYQEIEMAVLSVDMTKFSVKSKAGANVVNWITAAEKDNLSFDIERSNNATTFTKLGQVASKGNNEATKNYSFVDDAPMEGINYYRLKMVDADGKATFSKVVSIKNGGKNKHLALFPNPAAGELRVVATTDRDGEMGIKIIDMLGRIMVSEKRSVSKGDNQLAINVGQLVAGTYLLNVEGETMRFQKQ